MTEVRVKRGWSYGAHSYFRHGIQPRSWQAYTFPASKDTAETVKLLEGMLRDWKTSGSDSWYTTLKSPSDFRSVAWIFGSWIFSHSLAIGRHHCLHIYCSRHLRREIQSHRRILRTTIAMRAPPPLMPDPWPLTCINHRPEQDCCEHCD